MSTEQLSLEEQETETKETPNEIDQLKSELESLKTQIQTAELQNARLEERVNATPAAPEVKAPEVLTRQQLQEAVDSGQINQAQMDEELARQMRDSLKQELSVESDEKISAAEQKRKLQTKFDAYVRLKPDVTKAGSDDLRRVQEEIKELGTLGYPHDLRTEVLAMKNVFGPLDRVEETTRKTRETHQETGGSGEGMTKKGAGKEKWEEGLRPSQVEANRDQVRKGNYAGEDDPKFLAAMTRLRTKNANRSAA